VQLTGVGATALWSVVATAVIVVVVRAVVGLRVSAEDETQGLDFSQHGETAYNP
jgi:ammonium transporter, Amt family